MRSFFSIIFLFLVLSAYGQNNGYEGRLMEGDILENAVEKANSDDFNYDTYQQNLDYLKENPVNLNKAGAIELRRTTLFTEVQIRDLLQHIKYYGELLNLYELQTIPSFTLDDIERIKPYVALSDKITYGKVPFAKQLYTGNYQYFLRLQKILEDQAGYNNDPSVSNPYLGSNLRIYTRFGYNYQNRLRYGFTAEKDPGEEFFGTYEPYGFDFYSAHFFMQGKGFVKSLALGDYELKIGQGLTMWSGFGFGKSVYPLAIRRTGPVLDDYTSVNENTFLRGAAATMGKRNLYVTVFGSHKKLDANVAVVDTVDESVLEVSSITESGLHRNESELEDKDAISETIAGADVSYYRGQFSLGISSIYFHLSSDLTLRQDPYNYFYFSGHQLLSSSLHYNYLWRNVLFFGETAMSDNAKVATVNGLIIPLDRKMDIAILNRYFDKAYQTLPSYAGSFSDNAVPQNETGTYLGLEVRPASAWKVSGYLDVYRHPWLEFQTDGPSTGTDVLGQVIYQPSKAFQTYIRYKHELTDHNYTGPIDQDPESNMQFITGVDKTNIRWHLSYDMSKDLSLRSRIEISLYDDNISEPERGYIAFQDVNYHPFGKKWGINTRFCLFNTDSYNTRIYTYESDVLYAYSIIALYGRGTRYYASFSYSPTRWLDIWLRFSQTWYDEMVTESSSIASSVPGNTKSEGKVQVRIKW